MVEPYPKNMVQPWYFLVTGVIAAIVPMESAPMPGEATW